MPAIIASFDAGSDIAAVGIWDSKYCCDFYRDKKLLPVHAAEGFIFYINTGSDGGFPTRVIVDGEESLLDLKKYIKNPGKWGLTVVSGKVTVGGLEDFLSTERKVTSPENDLLVPPGEYTVEFYEAFISGEEDGYPNIVFSEREKRILQWHGRLLPIGCIGIVLTISIFMAKAWRAGAWSLVALMSYGVILNFVFKKLGIDEISKKTRDGEFKEPSFIFFLKSSTVRVPGGHIELNVKG